ncbi:hypothetical protein BGX27_001694 [Mortierella sp. AM989]|nr:hypothetical protein BGX27_001694 [Mortierella sp. AM989]
MEETQSFSLIGNINILEILVDCVGGQKIVYWEDIVHVFPGINHVQKGKVVISMSKDRDGNRIVPYRIKHYPGVVLDVVLATPVEYVHVDPLMAASLSSGHIGATADAQGTHPSAEAPIDASDTSPAVDAQADIQGDRRNDSQMGTCHSGATVHAPHANHPCSASAKLFGTCSPRALAESLPNTGTANNPCNDLSPTEPLHATMIRRTTTHIHRFIKDAADAVEEAVVASNRAGKPLDGSNILSIFEDNLPAEYRESIATIVTVVRELKALYEQGNITQQIVRQVLAEAQQIKDRLILIERKTAAILTQNYELLEFTIPRLFIVLPEAPTKWDPKTVIRTKFRLHFICECGEHTMPRSGSKMPHHLHLAQHEGYVVNKPTEFFGKYGPFLMLMLEMLKFGVGIAGYVVPALASLKVIDVVDTVQATMDSVTSQVIQGVDYSLSYLEGSRMQTQETYGANGSARNSQQDLANYLAGIEGLEGADLRQLGSYLTANSSDNMLGNLYRMTTKDGHVKWVCREHYRAGLEEELTQKLRDVIKLAKGMFDEQMGRIKISLKSSFAAAEFYNAVRRAKGVLELDVSLRWSPDYDDFVELKSTISSSKIRVITLHLFSTFSDADTGTMGSQPLDPILDLVRLPSVQAVEISGLPREFFKRSSPLPKKTDLSKLMRLRISGPWSIDKPGDDLDAEIAMLKFVVSKAPKLSILHLDSTKELLPAVLSSIGKYQTYPIDFGNLSLRLAPPLSKHRQSRDDVGNIEHVCSTYGAQFETLDLNKIGPENVIVESLAKAVQNGSSLKEITLEGFGRSLGERCVKALASIVAHCRLRKLRLDLETEDSRVYILESVPWKYVHELEITLREGQEVRVLTALVDGMNRMSESIVLECLTYTVLRKRSPLVESSIPDTTSYRNNTSALTSDQEDLLRSVMSLSSLKQLAISSQLTLVQVLALLQAVNFSRLQNLSLSPGSLNTTEVQNILDSLHNATQLQTITMPDVYFDEETEKRMLAKGITIRGKNK